MPEVRAADSHEQVSILGLRFARPAKLGKADYRGAFIRFLGQILAKLPILRQERALLAH